MNRTEKLARLNALHAYGIVANWDPANPAGSLERNAPQVAYNLPRKESAVLEWQYKKQISGGWSLVWDVPRGRMKWVIFHAEDGSWLVKQNGDLEKVCTPNRIFDAFHIGRDLIERDGIATMELQMRWDKDARAREDS